MCGRFTLAADVEKFAEAFEELDIEFQPRPRYNIAPSQPVATILNTPRRAVVASRWGLVPSWAKDPAIGSRMINARAETLEQKPSFRTPLRKRRCLVLADGFYEWQKTPGSTRKVPYYFRLASKKPFAFAGLWGDWHVPDGETRRTCTIITTDANDLVKPVHPRMPVILAPGDYAAWLAKDEPPAETLKPLLRPFPAERMESFPVSTRVNRVDNDDADCIRPAVQDDLFSS